MGGDDEDTLPLGDEDANAAATAKSEVAIAAAAQDTAEAATLGAAPEKGRAAAAATGGPVSGRNIFLREQAEQVALRRLNQKTLKGKAMAAKKKREKEKRGSPEGDQSFG